MINRTSLTPNSTPFSMKKHENIKIYVKFLKNPLTISSLIMYDISTYKGIYEDIYQKFATRY